MSVPLFFGSQSKPYDLFSLDDEDEEYIYVFFTYERLRARPSPTFFGGRKITHISLVGSSPMHGKKQHNIFLSFPVMRNKRGLYKQKNDI